MALIIVMEDDASTRMLVASVLKKDGHEVLTAEDGAQGLALLGPHRPDLIISDVQMPGMNGFQMLAEQKHQLAKLYEQRLAAELSERWPEGDGNAGDERLPSATVLFVDIPNYASVAEKLDSQELAELVKKFYGNANDTVHLFGAR